MTTTIGVLTTIFVLLPGFLVLRIRQSTREYRDLGNFQITTVSVAYSVAIFAIWFSVNILLEMITQKRYMFLEHLTQMSKVTDFDLFLSEFTAAMVLLYVGIFCAFGLLVYNFGFISIWFRFLHGVGATRFSQHLTPWEDFLTLNRVNWIAVELKDGRTFIGKIGLFSHLPFKRQIVLTRTSESPVIMYGEDNKKIVFGPEIDQTYVNDDEIRSMHSVVDKTITIETPSPIHYVFTFGTLVLVVLASIIWAAVVAVNITASWRHSPVLDITLGLLVLTFLLLNLISLRRHR